MNLIHEELSDETKKINEMFVSVQKSLDLRITNSIYYNKLKYLMFNEIVKYCKEKIDLRNDLLNLRTYIGEFLSEEEIIKYLDELKLKYNGSVHNIGIEYHIESTRIDYGVCVFCIIKRDDIYAKKFIFRFRKNPQIGLDTADLAPLGALMPEDKIKADVKDLLGGE